MKGRTAWGWGSGFLDQGAWPSIPAQGRQSWSAGHITGFQSHLSFLVCPRVF